MVNEISQCRSLHSFISNANVRPVPGTSRKSIVEPEHLEEAERLQELWNAHKPRPSQAEFGERFDIGSQGAVWQFLNGKSPLSMKAARGFAKGLHCSIADFSPRLAKQALEANSLATRHGDRTLELEVAASSARASIESTLVDLAKLLAAVPASQRAAVGFALEGLAMSPEKRAAVDVLIAMLENRAPRGRPKASRDVPAASRTSA